MWKKSSKSNLRTLPNVKIMKNKNGANDRINTTNIDLTFSYIKLSLKLLEFKWEKVIILQLLLMPWAWRVVLVCPHSISVSAIFSYTNMAATSYINLGFSSWKWVFAEFGHCHEKRISAVSASFKKVNNFGAQLETGRVGGFPSLFWK